MVAEIAAAPPVVTGAIRNASRMTGANFQYLLATAKVESNLNPTASGRTSSAKGLFQFIEQTWLATVKEQGAALGYGRYAEAIERTPNGYAVSDPRWESTILNLRNDPTANAVMAGAFTQDNASRLSAQLGRPASEGELYIAHFLGPQGAGRLIGLAADAPNVRAADAFPTAARANPSIFYDRGGQPRSVGQVYSTLVGRYANARSTAGAQPATAANVPLPPVRAVGQAVSPATAYAATAAAETQDAPVARLGDNGPAFYGLFQTPGARRDAVSPVVGALWGAPAASSGGDRATPSMPLKPAVIPETAAAAAPIPTAAPADPVRAPQPLDLFQDTLPDARALFRGRV